MENTSQKTIAFLAVLVVIFFIYLICFYKQPNEGLELTVHYYNNGIEVYPASLSIVTPPGGSYDQIRLEIKGSNTGNTPINLTIVDATPAAFKNSLPTTSNSLAVGASKSLWFSGFMNTNQFETYTQPVRFWINISGQDAWGAKVYRTAYKDLNIAPSIPKIITLLLKGDSGLELSIASKDIDGSFKELNVGGSASPSYGFIGGTEGRIQTESVYISDSNIFGDATFKARLCKCGSIGDPTLTVNGYNFGTISGIPACSVCGYPTGPYTSWVSKTIDGSKLIKGQNTFSLDTGKAANSWDYIEWDWGTQKIMNISYSTGLCWQTGNCLCWQTGDYKPYLEINYASGSMILYPTDDVLIDSSTPDGTFGGHISSETGLWVNDPWRLYVEAYFNPDTAPVYSLMKFNLSSIPAGTTLNSAILHLFITSADNSGKYGTVTKAGNLYIGQGLNNSWIEMTTSWNSYGSKTFSGSSVIFPIPFSTAPSECYTVQNPAPYWHAYDITSIVTSSHP